MAIAALYAAIIIVSFLARLTQAGVWMSGLINAAVLLSGLAATWRAWRWL